MTFLPLQGAEHQSALQALLNAAFQVPVGSSFYDDFPVWDDRFGVRIFKIGAFDGSRLVASASVRLAQLNTGAGVLPVAVVGAVVTESEYRGRGLASQAVNHVIDWARSQGAVVALLWGSEHSLYERLGFHLCGSQVRVPLKQLVLGRRSQGIVQQGWCPGLLRAMQKRSGGFVLSSSDEAWLAAHKNVHWYWTGESQNVQAYAAIDRGIDLAGLVHEWGGEHEALISLLKGISDKIPNAELLGGPEIFKQYQFNYDPQAIEYLCMAKILDRSRLPVDSDEVRSLFGDREDFEAGKRPLQFWVWGLDAA